MILLRVIISLASVFLTLALAESALQLRRWRSTEPAWYELLHRRSAIDGLAYELVPNRDKLHYGVPVHINSYGLRDDESRAPYDDSLLRIAVLGDSYTFGFGVSGEYTYPNVLERLLDEVVGEHRFEVLNFGVGGYSTRDEALVLRHRVLEWNPALIVVGYVLNDPEIEPRQPLHRFYNETQHWWNRLFLVELGANVAKNIRMMRHDSDYYEYLHYDQSPQWRSVIEAFTDIREATRERDIPLLLVIFPNTRDAPWAEYPYEHLHRQVTRAALENSFAVIDLLGAYSGQAPAGLMIREGDSHPTQQGHEFAARAILDWLQQAGRLPALLERRAASGTDG